MPKLFCVDKSGGPWRFEHRNMRDEYGDFLRVNGSGHEILLSIPFHDEPRFAFSEDEAKCLHDQLGMALADLAKAKENNGKV